MRTAGPHDAPRPAPVQESGLTPNQRAQPAILVVDVNGALGEDTRQSIDAAASRWGARFLTIPASGSPLHPACWKTEAFTLTAPHGVDRLLILDADVVVSELCPNPFAFFPDPARMVVVSDRQTHHPARDRVEADEWKRVTGADTRPARFFNSGFILADAGHHAGLFARAAELCRKFRHLCWHDQTPFNVAAQGFPNDLHFTDEAWNFLNPTGRLADWPDMERTGKFIYHFAGNPARNRQMAEVKWQGKHPDAVMDTVRIGDPV